MMRNIFSPINFYFLRPSALSICAYLREPIFFFSRRSTLIYFSLIYADFHLRPSALSICAHLREMYFFFLAD
jgi:hypothetical protein